MTSLLSFGCAVIGIGISYSLVKTAVNKCLIDVSSALFTLLLNLCCPNAVGPENYNELYSTRYRPILERQQRRTVNYACLKVLLSHRELEN